MSRAEIRREQKEKQKDNKVYKLTAKQLEEMEQRIRAEERQKAKQELKARTKQLANEIFTMMLVIPTNVLISDYWQKTAKKRIPKFVRDCASLYEAYTGGVVDMSQMVELTEEYAGIQLVNSDSVCFSVAEKVGK